ncbi:NAD-dependent epimerase/dehydratase family protein [Deinococcus arenicola]|uniref:NAD-dependent epimerase/dehydratase family protein n=1 Tax=Deinococcus arenicola TaxID=2994950 RepID=A0ABU4DVZ5_9DEIO|nr:NAD-dependent epimerase/dehydratase family protein [Deinococcus sp. ZS9-10]MDV6376605.1 NAD-dependent epimerase/dehydratase family protein [Deinococcus sp. ZS9-10]
MDAKIYVAGHDSLIGAVVCRRLEELGYWNIVTRGPDDLDLTNQVAVHSFFEQELPDYVFLASLAGEHVLDGLLRPAESLYSKVMIAFNIIHASYLYEVRKMLSIVDCQFNLEALRYEADEAAIQHYQQAGRDSDQLMRSMVTGLCDRYRQQYSCDFISVVFHVDPPDGNTLAVMPVVGGPVGQMSVSASPALERSAAQWQRDHLYAEDPAQACLFLMEHFSATGPITVRTGTRSGGLG